MLETKLHAPPARTQAVVRGRLLERLRVGTDPKLVLVAAPAGFGKTTLLSMWREIELAERPVAWLTLDDDDNDPAVLWSYILEALGRVCPAVAYVSERPERVEPNRILDAVLPPLVNRLAEQDRVALILDDFHRLSAGPARESLSWFIEYAPPSFQLFVSSRVEPSLPIAPLRAHGELLEIRADDLSFTTAEADAFLNGCLGLDLAADQIADLVSRTEGWPAGLYLAGLSIGGAEDRGALLEKFSGANRAVVDFLVDEVLEAHDPQTQALMIRSSILDRVCGPLCDAVLEREDAGELLGELSRTNLFLVPLDDHGQWYRFHHLFKQLLRVELERREPGLASTLHRRASIWHREHGVREKAIEHAIDAGDYDEAVNMVASAWGDYAHGGRHRTVLSWLRRFPVEVLNANQLTLLIDAWVLALGGNREGSEQAIAGVERFGNLDAGPLPDGFSSTEASLRTLQALITWGDVGKALMNARRAFELEPPGSRWRPLVCEALGHALYYHGDLSESEHWATESAEAALQRGDWLVALHSLTRSSFIAGDDGRLDDQRRAAEQAMQLAAEHRLEEASGLPYIAQAESVARGGGVAQALLLGERGLSILRGAVAYPLDLSLGLVRQAALLRAVGEADAFRASLGEAKVALDACPDPGVLRDRLAELERTPRARPRRENVELSERELVILRTLKGPLSERDIGRELYISHNTVHSHARSIYRKLGVSSRAEAVERARELGLISRRISRGMDEAAA